MFTVIYRNDTRVLIPITGTETGMKINLIDSENSSPVPNGEGKNGPVSRRVIVLCGNVEVILMLLILLIRITRWI